ncbi:bifunctional alpha/beta hydrolase/class I SAM-dependent methyltransferase [Roseomonas sp. KE2513]|uniref:bifunctional alpha/beta hydrolase/class I SAM-dependent methyltransferase n=1 Tax=Roseomonas sp. KE2513 TaxID=2479202 RepID=UPI0018E0124B|nr:bifunctional alpha/beta hydrolase/class I SAM-dependent methyltransferase [Roseomonas sp. KE2513]
MTMTSPEDATVRPCESGRFRTHDGTELFYRHWRTAPGVARRGAVLLVHRGHEHSGRVAHLADELDLPDFDVFAHDARGHGESGGERGSSPGFAASVRDLDAFVHHLGAAHGVAVTDLAVVAASVGAVLAATWVHDYAPPIRSLTLASPAFDVRLYVPFARPGLRLLQKLRGNFKVNSYVKPQLLTHDEARRASFAADPLITRPIAVNLLLGLYEAADRVVEDARAIVAPTQLLISGTDFVVRQPPQHRFFERLGSLVKERHVLPGFFHDTLGERDRAPVVAMVRNFILARFAQPPRPVPLLDADQAGHTRDEADALATPLPALSPRGLYWGATRLGLRLGGQVSQGIRLGHETGFDSGSTLDYVYRNRPDSRGRIGRAMDRTYLDSPGWRGIRQRKLNAEELLREAMSRLREAGQPVRVLDIAAGHGRYVLDAMEGAPVPPDAILLRDYSPINVEAGRRLIAERGLGEVARFEAGDAFDRDNLAAVDPRPTLAIVSGLYELFPGNDLIRRSLDGLAAAIPEGGYLVYTNQPWHPQLEMIARALTSHRGGQAWVMRRRTQAEMDQLVAAAGFRKMEQRIDEWGIFTVSLAQRVAGVP